MDLPREDNLKRCNFETAIDLTGFGKYNIGILAVCCLLILTMYMDIFGLSVLMPSVACDMSLSTSQQGILSAVPLIGVIISSYGWGLAADTIGRRKTLLIGMPIGFVLGLAASMAPNYPALTTLKFFSVMFTSTANAAAFVLVAESVPNKNRCRFMFIMSSATMFVMFLICICALPVFKFNIHWRLSWLSMVYRPWRLVLQIVCLPGAIGAFALLFFEESPKFLLSKEKSDEALAVLQKIYQANTGYKKEAYIVTDVFLDEMKVTTNSETSLLMKIWNQTAPLFKPPLLKNSLIVYYLLLCAYMISTGYTMWVPTMTNAFFTTNNSSGHTFCQMASQITNFDKPNTEDCDKVIKPFTLYAIMCYSGVSTSLLILLSFLVGPLGKKRTTLMIFAISLLCGVLLLFVKIPLLSIALFFMFLYVAQILGNVNAYLVDLNPTHLRGMASCLSVVVARGFGFISVQVIGSLLSNYCTPMLGGYIVLGVSGLLVAMLLPADSRTKEEVISDETSPKAIPESS